MGVRRPPYKRKRGSPGPPIRLAPGWSGGRTRPPGVAVTFVDWEDMPRWRIIDKTLGLEMPEPPETYHTSPHLFTDLNIPEGVSATLPKVDRTRAGLNAEVEEDLGGGRKRGRTDRGDRDRVE